MREKRIVRKLFPSYLAATLLALAAAVWLAALATEDLFRARVEVGLEERGRLIEGDVLPLLRAGDFARLDAFCKQRGRPAATRITVILPDGRVVADSDEAPASMANHRGRVEVAAALSGHTATSVHYSETLHRDMMYMALPLGTGGGGVDGVLRMSVPLLLVGEALRPFLIHIAWGVVVIAALAAVLSLFIARRLAAPLEELRRGAERLAGGDFSTRLSGFAISEIERVAQAMNGMAAELDRRVSTIVAQRNELEAILSSMAEGVLAVDTGGRILRANAAASRMLGLDEGAEARENGRDPVPPSVRAIADRSLAADEDVEMALDGEGGKSLQAHGTPLRDSRGTRTGALIVLNDVTRMKRLEGLRREFVANVSHELRTPITAIKGFVETLQDGALSSPDVAGRFLGIIAKQVDHVSAMIDDLLLLSRLDEMGDKIALPKEDHAVREVLESAVQVCSDKAAEKKVEVGIECDPGLRGRINAPLLEQAVVNLVDNGIKFSEPGTAVSVKAWPVEGKVAIEVTDRGCGVGADDLPRLFERFFRVDRARGRKTGGTGLGLAIVKHIVQVHGGEVAAESQPGKGSKFTMTIPVD